jgi:hypothetical protein
LRINNVHLFQELGPSLFVETIDRRGNVSLYHGVFSDIKAFKSEDMKKIQLPRGGAFWGAGISGENVYYLAHSFENDQSRLEVIDLFDQKVLQTFEIKPSGFFELVDWIFDGEKINILARRDVLEESIEDQSNSLVQVSRIESGDFLLKVSENQKLVGDARLIKGKERLSVVWLDRGTSESKVEESKFRAVTLKDGIFSDPYVIADAGDVERWSLFSNSGKTLIVSVRGDTLMWNNPRTEFLFIEEDRGFKTLYARQNPLDKVHLGAPHIVSRSGGLQVFFQQWLDHESTIVGFNFAEGQVSHYGNFGVFLPKRQLVSVFFHEISKKTHVIMKDTNNHNIKHSICLLR